MHQTAETIKKRGLFILISDLFDDPENVLSGLQHFRYKGHEVVVFHILDPQELNLNFSQRTRFRDMESGEEIITDPRQIKNEYKKSISAFCEKYRLECTQNNIDFIHSFTIGDKVSDINMKKNIIIWQMAHFVILKDQR